MNHTKHLLDTLFNTFEAEDITYCVLHGYDTLPESTTSDVDIAIDHSRRTKLDSIVTEVSLKTGFLITQKIYYDIPHCYFYVLVHFENNLIEIQWDPGKKELNAVKQADAVILPQGCRQTLYEMVIAHCPHVFPDYGAKFKFPGKIGQAELFAQYALPHPRTETFVSLDDFFQKTGYPRQTLKFDPPFVFKFDWGGEGDTVSLIDSLRVFKKTIEKAASYERTGQYGFLIQEFITTTGNRSLRVVVIGQKRISYWRIPADPARFGTAVSKGAKIDKNSDFNQQAAGIKMVDRLCEKTGINLAGIDLIFPKSFDHAAPLFLEINYFFGRTGIGGSDRFYGILESEIKNWLKSIGL